MAIRIGISGWRYKPWRGVFYPEGLPQRRELEYAAERFGSIEVNGSFYSLQWPASYSAWREALALLRRHDVALVAADTAGKFPYFDETTAGFSYVRLHGGTQLYVSGYSKAELATWARRIRRWAKRGDVYCYFDNDAKVHAPFDALALMERLGLT